MRIFSLFIIIYSLHIPGNMNAQNLNGIHLDFVDTSVSACDNFYQYASGKWLDTATIPDPNIRYGFFDEKDKKLDHHIINMFDSFGQSSSSVEQEMFKFYITGLNINDNWQSELINEQLQMIQKIQSMSEISYIIGYFQRIGISPFFKLYDPPTSELRGIHFLGFTVSDTMQTFSGLSPLRNALNGIIQKELKRDQRGRKELIKTHKLRKMMPLDWDEYFKALEIDPDKVVISSREYLEEIGYLLSEHTIEELKTFLEEHISQSSKDIFDAILGESKSSSIITPYNQKQKVISEIQKAIPYISGRLFHNHYISPQMIEGVQQMTNQLKTSYISHFQSNKWLSKKSKQGVINKVKKVKVLIGGPDIPLNSLDLIFTESNFIQNVFLANKAESNIWLQKYGKDIADNNWHVDALNPNAWFNSVTNTVSLPAATITQLYSQETPGAINYGLLGTTIAHEMAHAFETLGIQYDAEGDYRPVLSKNDYQQFQKRCEKQAAVYDTLIINDGHFTNGNKALIESIPDHLCVLITFDAFQKAQKNDTIKLMSFTSNQLFFIAYAQKYRDVISETCIGYYINHYYHPLPKYRVNIPLYSMPEFFETFCPEAIIQNNNVYSIW